MPVAQKIRLLIAPCLYRRNQLQHRLPHLIPMEVAEGMYLVQHALVVGPDPGLRPHAAPRFQFQKARIRPLLPLLRCET
jgi:hypothetical protein